MTHKMGISRVGFFGAIAAHCECGWISKRMTGSRQTKKAHKAFSKHLMEMNS